MRKSAQDYTAEVDQAIEDLKREGFEVPANFVNMMPADIMAWAEELSGDASRAIEIAQKINEFANIQNQVAQQQQNFMENEETTGPGYTGPTMAATKPFNMKKAQLLAEPPELMEEEALGPLEDEVTDGLIFRDGAELKDWLDGTEPEFAIDQLMSVASDAPIVSQQDEGKVVDPMEVIKGGIQRFYQDNTTDQERLRIAMDIFDILPNSVKEPEPDQEQTISAPFEAKEAVSFVEDVHSRIKRMANVPDSPEKRPYNLRKSAQAGTIENVILWGPREKRIDPFLGQPVSDWSIVERNKGFGLVVDDEWGIDWEAIWRGSIMDKYSRPYRDRNGNWVGGYIQKRFEVDKWRPEYTNMQLKPGQKRHARPPEFGNLEARMEAMRHGDGVNKPVSISTGKEYTPGSIGEPKAEAFNWQKSEFNKVASVKKKV